MFEETELLANIEKNNVPIVILGRDLTGRKISSLLVDNEAGGALALQHLNELGHRAIAVIRGPEELFYSPPRRRALKLTESLSFSCRTRAIRPRDLKEACKSRSSF